MKQKTILSPIAFSGKALQTGSEARMRCAPALADAGITFKRVDMAGNPSVNLGDAVLSGDNLRRSTIGAGPMAVQTVEHFLAALWCLGIDNIVIEVEGEELPALDGSAAGFIEKLESAGIKELPRDKKPIRVTEKENVSDGARSISILPAETFSVSYSIDYKVASIGRETLEMELDKDSFKREIAPARTFCLKSEAETLLKAGLGKGATLENTLVMDEDGPVGTVLRFPNEPLRHKILDLVGDLYLLGRPVIGKVIAEKSGHKLNAGLVRLLYAKYVKE